MTNRVLLNTTGLKISKPGVDVLTATESNLLFNSSGSSFPITLKAYAAIQGGFDVVTSLYFGRTFPSPPFVALFWSSGVPAATTTLYGFCPPSNVEGYLWPTSYNASSGDSTFWFWTVYNNRVEFVSKRDHSSGASAYAMTGYVSAIVYDFW